MVSAKQAEVSAQASDIFGNGLDFLVAHLGRDHAHLRAEFLRGALLNGVELHRARAAQQVGDEVLDTSVRARLEQMKVALTA